MLPAVRSGELAVSFGVNGSREQLGPPRVCMVEMAGQLADPIALADYMDKAWQLPSDDSAGHPSYAQRLSAVGYDELPIPEPISKAALAALLAGNAADRYSAGLDTAWTNRIANLLQ